MTAVTPSSVPDIREQPAVGTGPNFTFRYHHVEMNRYSVPIARGAPFELQVTLEFGQEPEGVWAHILELDVSAEGADTNEAFWNVLGATRDWLGYVREEHPQLGDDLAAQERYVALLDAPIFSWFKSIKFSD